MSDWRGKSRTSGFGRGNFQGQNRFARRKNRRRIYTVPDSPKECYVVDINTGRPMLCVPFGEMRLEKRTLRAKQLILAEDSKEYTVFSSHRKAQAAIWFSVMLSGVPMSHVNYDIVDVK